MSPSPRLEKVLELIDDYNRRDPRPAPAETGGEAYEFWYSKKLTEWVLRLRPDASDTLRIAARGQHIGRWTSPRSHYPMDRGGYLRWREDLKRFHAKTVTDFMAQAGYAPEEMEIVRQVILKKNFQTNPDAQSIEDGLCLVFLESQFEDLIRKTPEDKMLDIIRKTWKKMSPAGQSLALRIAYPPHQSQLLKKALNL